MYRSNSNPQNMHTFTCNRISMHSNLNLQVLNNIWIQSKVVFEFVTNSKYIVHRGQRAA